MPTRDRRAFVGQAVWYFLRQDYTERELIILDDGSDSIADLLPLDTRIRYMRLPSQVSLGCKLNKGCEAAHGQWIVHWEDDDWIGPHRLSTQIRQLMSGIHHGCSASEVLHYHLTKGQAWQWAGAANEAPTMKCGLVAYRRRFWEESPFPDADIWPSQPFPPSVSTSNVFCDWSPDYYVKIVHADNSTQRNFRGESWKAVPLGEVAARLSADVEFYSGIRHGHRETSSRTADRVTFAAPFTIYDGYGSMAQYLSLGLARSGARVDVVPLRIDRAGLSAELLELIDRSDPQRNAPTIAFVWPRENLCRLAATRDLFLYTMWESSLLPAGYAESLSGCRAIFVPTEFVRQVFVDSGVTCAIIVIPLGIDPATYHLETRPERAGLHVLTVGTFVPRRNIEVGVEAWKLAFADDPDARLTIKSRFKVRPFASDDPRIRFIDSDEATVGVAQYYRDADVLLALGSEGFGLPLVEGMATGLPVIALNSEGQADICRAARDLVLPVSPSRWVNTGMPFPDCGVRGVPDARDVVAQLKWIVSHRAEAKAMGAAASVWVTRNRNIWDAAPVVLDEIERHLVQPRPLRRRRTLLVPSWKKPCGVAEYTAELAARLPDMQVCSSIPDGRSVSLLHVQHEFSLFSDAELERSLRSFRRRNIPVAVTAHTILPQPRAWESEVDAFVSLTRRGAGWLTQRYPNKLVTWIPYGCPEYFPRRKQKRGRTIGAFGFLHPHKGFWHLLEVLRKLGDVDLVLYSHAVLRDSERAWEQASAGLPVRRIGDFLSAEDIATRLAAEADLLVFWYSDVGHASASGAIRIGLATGVPVLASCSSMFEDLEGVLYQPDDLVTGVETLLDDTVLCERLTDAARQYCADHSWERVAAMYQSLWNRW
jgi:glycosyltransferase involved in cell wall biosynthesis